MSFHILSKEVGVGRQHVLNKVNGIAKKRNEYKLLTL